MASDAVVLQVPGPGGVMRDVRISSPDRLYFDDANLTKLDLANYYLAVSDGITRALVERPCMLHRFPKGTSEKKVHQKKLPAGAPDWIETVDIFFPRYSRTVQELCVTEPAAVLRAAGYDVDFGPFGSSVSVPTGDVGTVAALVLTTAFGHGATHVNLDVGAPQ